MAKKGKMDILYEDKYIIIINKPAHLLTISTEKEKNRTLFNDENDIPELENNVEAIANDNKPINEFKNNENNYSIFSIIFSKISVRSPSALSFISR